MTPTLQTDSPADRLSRFCSALKRELGASPYWPLRHLVCQIDRDRITVQGTVSTFYLKQVAQTVATKVAGIECVRSEIDVEPERAERPGNDA